MVGADHKFHLPFRPRQRADKQRAAIQSTCSDGHRLVVLAPARLRLDEIQARDQASCQTRLAPAITSEEGSSADWGLTSNPIHGLVGLSSFR